MMLTDRHADTRAQPLLPQSPHLRRDELAQQQSLRQQRAFCLTVGQLALRSLYRELQLYPKPGLVSPVDSGSHADMDVVTFMRSLFALRHYFIRITQAGMAGTEFAVLKQLGMDAERAMLRATAGINTHRGAIFCLGMLCATAGYCHARRMPLSAAAIRASLLIQWGDGLSRHMQDRAVTSHGTQVAQKYAVSGASEEAALGFPSLFELALPRFLQTLGAGRGYDAAAIDTLFTLMATINDTNLYHRGGLAGADKVKTSARQFLDAGGCATEDWRERAISCHSAFIQDKLSPGGAADLLAATYFMHGLSYLR
ncbi:triphosphoribosyl-dephospho-CoA synthase [Collimonas sp. OK607]|uniref:triphosphoribosyl-dephospho-CoA synthase MdcB n=1 Tax=Collimonas sp. OK607 TaxID=1798194 RepID=UPI0008DFC8C3|nr:triphosphoribosyl-dephospho-CoA synthase MdcB [Collimonas sp. OK607]SFB07320.1 triphosphoribosyl-dephospho-CoA synthase [Collimonas sp. OK607]